MSAPGHNLPVELTSFVGRARELAEARRLLAASRLLTLTGAGGVGKTRLAVELARRPRGRFEPATRFVDLAPLQDARMLPHTVAAAVGAIEHPERPLLETLVAELADRRLLLLLDNCDRLVPGCAELAHALLSRCRGLTVLATSREPLGVAGEQTWIVPPLSPEEGRDLLIERVRLGRPDLRLTLATEEQLATLCAQLDAIPLALELAAARLRTMGLEDLVARLEGRLDILDAGPRPPPVSAPCARRSNGATTCSRSPSGRSSGAWPSSRAAFAWMTPRPSARAARSSRRTSPGSSGGSWTDPSCW